MNTDKSKIMYDKLDEVVHKKVKLHLKKGEIKTDVIVGFFHGAAEYVERWVFQETDDETNEAIILNAEEGEIIKQKDILQVFFFDDKSQIIF